MREWERSGFFDVTKKELADEQVVMVGVSIRAFNRLLLIVFFMTMYHSYSSVAAFVVATLEHDDPAASLPRVPLRIGPLQRRRHQ